MSEEQRSARAIIRIAAIPDSNLGRVLSGQVDATARMNRRIVSDAERAAREQTRINARFALQRERLTAQAAMQSERLNAKSAASAERALRRQTQTAEREAKRAADAKIREEQRAATETARFQQRVAEAGARLQIRINADMAREREKSYRAQARDAQRFTREQERNARAVSSSRRRIIAGLAGAGFGAVTGAVGLVGQGQSLAGVGSLEERLSVGGDFRQQMITTANEAKASPEERKKVEESVLKASERTNVSIMDMAQALTAAQQNFDQFKEFAGIIGDLAEVSAGKGTALADLVNVMGAASTGLNLKSDAEKRAFLDVLVSTSERGSLEAGAVGRELGPLMPQFALRTGRQGVGAAREFLALAQVLGKSEPGQAAEVSTQIERFLLELSTKKTQQKLKAAGVEVTEGGVIGGQLKDLGEIGQLMISSKKFQKSSVRQGSFGRVEALKAAEFLMSALKDDPDAFRKLQNIDAGAGLASASRGFAQLQEDPMFKLRQIGTHAQASAVRDSDRIVKTISPAVEQLTKLQLQFPLLTESFALLTSTVKGLIAAMVSERLIFGRSIGNMSTSAAQAASAIGAEGGLAAKLSAFGQLIGVFTAGYFGTKAALSAAGVSDEDLQTGVGASAYDRFFGETPRTPYRGMPKGLPGAKGDLAPVPFGSSARVAAEDIKAFAAAVGQANRKDPAKVTVEVLGPGRVTRIAHGDGLAVDVTDTGNIFSPAL